VCVSAPFLPTIVGTNERWFNGFDGKDQSTAGRPSGLYINIDGPSTEERDESNPIKISAGYIPVNERWQNPDD
jgi:hypothetical protein